MDTRGAIKKKHILKHDTLLEIVKKRKVGGVDMRSILISSSLCPLLYPFLFLPLPAVLSFPLPPSVRCSILTTSTLCPLFYTFRLLPLSAVLSCPLPPSARCSILSSSSLCPLFYPYLFLPLPAVLS